MMMEFRINGGGPIKDHLGILRTGDELHNSHNSFVVIDLPSKRFLDQALLVRPDSKIVIELITDSGCARTAVN